MYLYYYYLSIPLILISNLMIILSKSFFFMWMIMEINLISFISILILNKILFYEIIMNYFLIQSFNSHLFLMINIMMNFNFMNKFLMYLLFFCIINKMGMPPFHFWYLKIMKYVNWMTFYLNSSIQKFIPLMILNYFLYTKNFKISYLFMFTLLISSIIPLFSINTSSLKLIMSFSSIIQMSWNMLMITINEILWMIYFLIYNIISFSIYYIFFIFNINYLNNLNSNFINKKSNLFFISLLILSLAGLPPFSGFMIKWMFMNTLFNFLSIYNSSLLLILSLLNLFFYIRMLNLSLMFFYKKNNMNLKFINMNDFKYLNLTTIIIISNLMIISYELI